MTSDAVPALSDRAAHGAPRASIAVASTTLATGLVAARLVDMRDRTYGGNDISLPMVAIVIGGGILVECTTALELVQRRAWGILACCVYFLVFTPVVGWLSLATLGDLFGMLFIPPSQVSDGIQLPLHAGGLVLLGLAATMAGHLIQGALFGERFVGASGWLGWGEPNM